MAYLRDATLEDVDDIFAISRNKEFRGLLPPVMKNWLEYDIVKRKGGCVRYRLIVAVENDVIIGYARYLHRLRPEKDSYWQTTLHEIAVLPEWQRKGIGRQLMDACIQDFTRYHAEHRHEASQLFLKSPDHSAANDFYRAMGFSECGVEASKQQDVRNFRMMIGSPAKQPHSGMSL